MTGAELKPKQIKALLLLLVLVPFIPTVLILRLLIDAAQTERNMDRVGLESFYSQSLAAVMPSAANRILAANWRPGDSPVEIFNQAVLSGTFDGALVYGTNGELLYPKSTDTTPGPVAFSSESIRAVSDVLRAQDHLADRWQELRQDGPSVFALPVARDEKTVVLLRRRETLYRVVHDFYAKAFDPAVKVVLVDGIQVFAPGAGGSRAEPVARAGVPGTDRGWQVLLYPVETRPLRSVIEDQAAYFWAAGVAIFADLFIAGVAVFAVTRQLSLHEMNSTTLATVSHELKTPLASTRVLLDTILEGRCSDARQEREYVELIAREHARMGRLIENFLAFARFEKGTYPIKRAPVAAGDLLRGSVAALDLQTHALNCDLSVEIPEALPMLLLDQEAMTVVFVNLIENALKYSGDVKKIRLTAGLDRQGIRMDVSDNGIGLSKRDQRRIFQPFYQVDQKLSRRTGGCGLGLSIAHHIVQAHGGSIEVRSKLNEGSIFSVWIPLPEGAVS